MAIIQYDMLVRDKYASILERGGKKHCNTSTISESDLLDRLADKLEEEIASFAREYDAENDERALNELADIVEVVRNIVSNLGLTDDAFNRIIEARNAMYGTFENRVLLESVEDVDETNTQK